jgi:hypothetical protein
MSEANDAVGREVIDQVLEAGRLAPSAANNQPWLVRVRGACLEVYVDPEQAQSFVDIDKTMAFTSLGCFIEHLAIAAHGLGVAHDLSLERWSAIGDPVAKLTLSSGMGVRPISAPDRRLYELVSRRCTNRLPGTGQIIDAAAMKSLSDAVTSAEAGIKLSTVSDAASKECIGAILGRIDRLRMVHRELHAQMFKDEIRWTEEDAELSNDGVDIRTVEDPALIQAYNALRSHEAVLATPRETLEAGTVATFRTSSHIACLSTSGPATRERFLAAGRCVARLFLAAAGLDVAMQPWTVLPYLHVRAADHDGMGLSREEREEILTATAEARQVFGLAPRDSILFYCRLSRAPVPKVKARRRTLQCIAKREP